MESLLVGLCIRYRSRLPISFTRRKDIKDVKPFLFACYFIFIIFEKRTTILQLYNTCSAFTSRTKEKSDSNFRNFKLYGVESRYIALGLESPDVDHDIISPRPVL